MSSSSQPVPIDDAISTHESLSNQPVETRYLFYTHDSHDLNIKRYPQWVDLSENHFGIIAGSLEGGGLMMSS